MKAAVADDADRAGAWASTVQRAAMANCEPATVQSSVLNLLFGGTQAAVAGDLNRTGAWASAAKRAAKAQGSAKRRATPAELEMLRGKPGVYSREDAGAGHDTAIQFMPLRQKRSL